MKSSDNKVFFTLTKFMPINGKGKKDGDITFGYRLCDDYGSLTVDHFENGSKQSKVLLNMSPQQIVDLIRKEHPEFLSRIYTYGLYINNRYYKVDVHGSIVDDQSQKNKRTRAGSMASKDNSLTGECSEEAV